jgi:hypothetical protein
MVVQMRLIQRVVAVGILADETKEYSVLILR